jgi:hypothetical protein
MYRIFVLQFKNMKHNTTQHNTTQHNTTQHNTTQHNKANNQCFADYEERYCKSQLRKGAAFS